MGYKYMILLAEICHFDVAEKWQNFKNQRNRMISLTEICHFEVANYIALHEVLGKLGRLLQIMPVEYS